MMLVRGLFLLIVEDEVLHEQTSSVCQRLSVTRRARSLEQGLQMLETQAGWAAVVVDARLLGTSIFDALQRLRNAVQDRPVLLLTKPGIELNRTLSLLRIESVDPRHGRFALESFARRALVLDLLPDKHVATWVDRLSADRRLTPREVQLLAYALGREPRSLVLKRLGVTTNTLKTQVRALLRKCGGRSMTDLAQRVVRAAHDAANDPTAWIPEQRCAS